MEGGRLGLPSWQRRSVVRHRMHLIARLGLPLVALALVIGAMGVMSGEAAKPYEGTSVKVIVNAEYVKYAMSLIEKTLHDTHGIKLEVEVIPGEAFVTKTLLGN